jgi:hypothetical protein
MVVRGAQKSFSIELQPLSFWSSPNGSVVVAVAFLVVIPAGDLLSARCIWLSSSRGFAFASVSTQNHSPRTRLANSINSHPKGPSIVLHPAGQTTSSFVSSPTMLVRPKIKLKFVAYFFAAKITRLLHHVYHADHHVLTIKKPCRKRSIFQNTPEKCRQTH